MVCGTLVAVNVQLAVTMLQVRRSGRAAVDQQHYTCSGTSCSNSNINRTSIAVVTATGIQIAIVIVVAAALTAVVGGRLRQYHDLPSDCRSISQSGCSSLMMLVASIPTAGPLSLAIPWHPILACPFLFWCIVFSPQQQMCNLKELREESTIKTSSTVYFSCLISFSNSVSCTGCPQLLTGRCG